MVRRTTTTWIKGSLILLAVCALALNTACTATDDTLVVLGAETISVEVADDDASRSLGLQDHDSLADGTGMLFVWEDAQVRTFAMKEVSFPIEVLFIDEGFRVASIEPLSPGDSELVSGPSPSQYVLELPAGWALEHDIVVGSPFVPPVQR